MKPVYTKNTGMNYLRIDTVFNVFVLEDFGIQIHYKITVLISI